jgi:cytochrome P450
MRFDPELDAWILTSYAEVNAALREKQLSAVSARGDGNPGTFDETAHERFREEARSSLSAVKLAEWRDSIEPLARRMLDQLPADRPVDLVSEFAQPWALAVALIVTGAKAEDAKKLNGWARAVFLAAAEPFDAELQKAGEQATVELARELSSPLDIQTFVALSQALPGFLAHAWLTLLEHPGDAVFPDAMEELLRYATPSRAQFRRALVDVELNGTRIESGQRVILMLAEANRDPLEFSEPDCFDPHRAASHHVAFGAGAHACVGAALVRMAATLATEAFLHDFAGARLVDGVVWREGFALRSPASLWVMRDNRTGGKTR